MKLLRLLPYFPLLFGAVAALLAWFSWTAGDPPAWVQFAPRRTATVLSSEARTVPVGNGTTRREAFIILAWPGADGGTARLGGIRDSLFPASGTDADAAVAAHGPGATVTVKVHAGRPYVDSADGFALAHAIFLTLFAILSLAAGLYILVRSSRSRAA